MKPKYVSHEDLFFMLVTGEAHSGRLFEGPQCWAIGYLNGPHLVYRHRDEFQRLLLDLDSAYRYVTEGLGAAPPLISAQMDAAPADEVAHTSQISMAILDLEFGSPEELQISMERLSAERAAFAAIEKRSRPPRTLRN